MTLVISFLDPKKLFTLIANNYVHTRQNLCMEFGIGQHYNVTNMHILAYLHNYQAEVVKTESSVLLICHFIVRQAALRPGPT